MDILRIATAGSVDDGKSTLIGRLLYDTRSITADKLEAVASSSRKKGLDFTDLSLLTDGLIAEREQGITIDVANIYFATDTRKYIIADTPGHIEYTRNMITGASNTEASIVLVDARNGVIEQTRRHLFISALLQIEHVFVCINKMDLVDFDESAFLHIAGEISALAEKIGLKTQPRFIPIAAKDGDNVVSGSERTPWYQGQPLLHYLEAIPVHRKAETLAARLPVQLVIRPHTDEYHDYRGYAGRLLSGHLRVGETVSVLPGGKTSAIKSITVAGAAAEASKAGDSVTIELADDIDISRGNMLATGTLPAATTQLKARLTWMDEQVLTSGRNFLLQHGVNLVKSKLQDIISVLDIQAMEYQPGKKEMKLNDIGEVSIRLAKPVFADLFAQHPQNGSFILIDEFSHNTVAVGLIYEL